MKCVGAKQVLKSIHEKKVKKVYIAKDADNHITDEIIKLCKENNLQLFFVDTMVELGKKAGIDVKASSYAE